MGDRRDSLKKQGFSLGLMLPESGDSSVFGYSVGGMVTFSLCLEKHYQVALFIYHGLSVPLSEVDIL